MSEPSPEALLLGIAAHCEQGEESGSEYFNAAERVKALRAENAELRRKVEELERDKESLVDWADELCDRIRDIYLNTEQAAMRRDDVAGEDIGSAEKECRLRHEAIVRPLSKDTGGPAQ